jgi:hypothetical protein
VVQTVTRKESNDDRSPCPGRRSQEIAEAAVHGAMESSKMYTAAATTGRSYRGAAGDGAAEQQLAVAQASRIGCPRRRAPDDEKDAPPTKSLIQSAKVGDLGHAISGAETAWQPKANGYSLPAAAPLTVVSGNRMAQAERAESKLLYIVPRTKCINIHNLSTQPGGLPYNFAFTNAMHILHYLISTGLLSPSTFQPVILKWQLKYNDSTPLYCRQQVSSSRVGDVELKNPSRTWASRKTIKNLHQKKMAC